MAVQEKVFRLEIAVDNVARVQVIKGFNNASRVETGRRIVKVAAIPQDRPQFAAETGLHQHVDVLVIPVCVE